MTPVVIDVLITPDNHGCVYVYPYRTGRGTPFLFGGISITRRHDLDGLGRLLPCEVNAPATGTVSAEDADQFAHALRAAADICRLWSSHVNALDAKAAILSRFHQVTKSQRAQYTRERNLTRKKRDAEIIKRTMGDA